MKVSEAMTTGCKTCTSTATVAEAARLMASEDIGVVPIAEDDRLIGTLTDRDIVVRGIANGRKVENATVRDFMTDQVFYCYDDQDCEEVAANMGELQVRRLPVVNRDKRLVGMITIGDLAINGQAAPAGYALSGIAQPG